MARVALASAAGPAAQGATASSVHGKRPAYPSTYDPSGRAGLLWVVPDCFSKQEGTKEQANPGCGTSSWDLQAFLNALE
eukprot:14546267-Heterocapsa_arctica.AAC.1